jgi:hypothetical protein
MITSKEKAIELVSKFMNLEPAKLSDYSKIYLPTAKQCALILVDEFIGNAYLDDELKYWQDIREEIEKL